MAKVLRGSRPPSGLLQWYPARLWAQRPRWLTHGGAACCPPSRRQACDHLAMSSQRRSSPAGPMGVTRKGSAQAWTCWGSEGPRGPTPLSIWRGVGYVPPVGGGVSLCLGRAGTCMRHCPLARPWRLSECWKARLAGRPVSGSGSGARSTPSSPSPVSRASPAAGWRLRGPLVQPGRPVPPPAILISLCVFTLLSPDMCLVAPWGGQGRAGPAAWPREPGWHRRQAVGQGWLPEL